jgi:hypothetical protein
LSPSGNSGKLSASTNANPENLLPSLRDTELMRELLSHILCVSSVLLGYAGRFVKQMEYRLSCFVESIIGNYGIFCLAHVHTPKFRIGW